MVTVQYNDSTDRYEVVSRGKILSQHTAASAAKSEGKKQGRKKGEPVSYKGPRMNSAKYIYRPSSEDQFGGSSSSATGDNILDKLGF